MSRPHRILRTCLAIAAMAFFGAAALADESATAFIRARQDEMSNLLRQPKTAARDKKVSTLLDNLMDYTLLAKRSLAAHWDDLTEAQRKDFTDLLRRLVQRSYEKNIQGIVDYNVEYLGEDPGPGANAGTVVHTRATSAKSNTEPVVIDYRVEVGGPGGPKVVDIVTEGSSLVANYKNQFHRIIQKDGFDTLMRRMKDKLAKGETT